ncbi:hypothetical protein GCM10025873_21300 [Demequina sediminis]|nr:hypothetical protein GCM10025873_21300 [Demequina sediminis]
MVCVILSVGDVTVVGVDPGEITSRQACNGSRPLQRSGKLLIKPSEWAGSASASRSDGQIPGKAHRSRGGQSIQGSHPSRNANTNPASRPQASHSQTYSRFNPRSSDHRGRRGPRRATDLLDAVVPIWLAAASVRSQTISHA